MAPLPRCCQHSFHQRRRCCRAAVDTVVHPRPCCCRAAVDIVSINDGGVVALLSTQLTINDGACCRAAVDIVVHSRPTTATVLKLIGLVLRIFSFQASSGCAHSSWYADEEGRLQHCIGCNSCLSSQSWVYLARAGRYGMASVGAFLHTSFSHDSGFGYLLLR